MPQNDERRKEYNYQYYQENKHKWEEYNERSKEYRANYYKARREELRLRRRHWEKAYRQRLKLEVLGYYSNGEPTCKICGEKRMDCLSIDHINGGGRRHTASLGVTGGEGLYRWLKKNGYPTEYQVLCMNCQFIKALRK